MAFERYGRLAEAEANYAHVLQTHPDCPSAWYNSGNLYERLGRRRESEGCFRRAVALQPRQHLFWNNLGNSMRDDSARNGEALHSYGTALALLPGFAGARLNRAGLLVAMERRDEAIGEYDALLKQDPTNAQARAARADALLAAGQLEAAERDYRAALDGGARSAALLNNLCLVRHRLDRLEEAMAACREALALDERHAWAWFNLGKTQGKVGSASSLDESVSSYVRALRLQPGWVPVWEALGSAFEAAGRSVEARHSFGRAAELRGPGVLAAQAPHESAESEGGAEEAAEARRRANAASAADLVNLVLVKQ